MSLKDTNKFISLILRHKPEIVAEDEKHRYSVEDDLKYYSDTAIKEMNEQKKARNHCGSVGLGLFLRFSRKNSTLPINAGVSIINFGKKGLASFVFHIPAYQRPYSWGEDQIDEFLKTIIDGFNDNTLKFFGTM